MDAKDILCLCSLALLVLAGSVDGKGAKDLKFLVVTVATDETDGYKRFMDSCRFNNLDVKVLGMGEEWLGGDVRLYPGGGQKVNILKRGLEEFKDDENRVLMFVDSYDVVLLASAEKFLEKFLEFDAELVFSAEGFCWPDKSLKDKYPKVAHGKRYLCSGGFIGYAPTFYKAITDSSISDADDDQLFYTKLYLNPKKREKLKLKLDHKSEVFQNLNGAEDDMEINMEGEKVWLENIEYGTLPLVAHGNGASKLFLNYVGNYLPNEWNPRDGCVACKRDTVDLSKLKEEEYPKVLMAIFIELPTPFMPEFFQRIMALDYPKKRIDLFVHNQEPHHTSDVANWLTEEMKEQFSSVTVIQPSDNVKEYKARNHAIELCTEKACDKLFVVDSNVVLTNKDTLRILIEQNRPVLAPMMSKYKKLWSNFWGAIGADGYYARSLDYIDIVNYRRRGVWNSPFITHIYLIQKEVLPMIKDSYGPSQLDPDMAFCKFMRDKGVFFYVTNMDYFGHLKELSSYTTEHLHNDMWQIFENVVDWEDKYLHENYSDNSNRSIPIEEPCPDVYWFPLVSPMFAKHLVEEMENFGQWSGGRNEDARLAGGYENVPTVDIHMNQIGYERHWLHFLKQYVVPVNGRLYSGYNSEAHAIMNFVVKYNPKGQYYLRPHHDASTYTINIALSRPGIDYGGGGCRFLRYNCSVTQTRLGWTFMHPGRLTHQHEGLTTTWGTRYIMVSFIDP